MEDKSTEATNHKFSDRSSIKKWVVGKISEYTDVPEEDIGEHDLIEGFGIDSAGAVTLSFDIEDALNLDESIHPEVLFKHDTIGKLTDFMFDKLITK